MPKFKPYNYDQTSMVVINYQDQLQPGTFEYAIHQIIEHKIDLSIFFPDYCNDDGGRPAYDPSILLKIILFAYAKGITSSREIEWCCNTNIIFKALSCDTVPHFTTIASFVSSHPKAIENLFEQVLLICHEQGLLGNELFAIDGSKMRSNAAKEHSGTFKELGEKRDKLRRQIRHHLKEHQKLKTVGVRPCMVHSAALPQAPLMHHARPDPIRIQGQWQLYCMVHNIEKIMRYGKMAA